jgi:hypothetical protein
VILLESNLGMAELEDMLSQLEDRSKVRLKAAPEAGLVRNLDVL